MSFIKFKFSKGDITLSYKSINMLDLQYSIGRSNYIRSDQSYISGISLHPQGTEHPNRGVLLHKKAQIIFYMNICSQYQHIFYCNT
jgi:hypothetical protein